MEEVFERTAELAVLHCELFGETSARSSTAAVVAPLGLSDQTVVELIRSSKQAAKFNALFGGDTGGYADDDSLADMALCGVLAFYCDSSDQIDRIFRSSGLIREKWDSRRGASTYGADTIAKAWDSQTEHYKPSAAQRRRQPRPDERDEPDSVEDDRPEPEPVAAYVFSPSTSSGFLLDFISWREQASDAPLEYAEALAVVVLSAVAGPRLRIPIRQASRPIHCGVYVLLLGGSSVYRKSDSLSNAEELLRELFPEVLMDMPGSPEGFVQDLARHEDFGAVLAIDEAAWWFHGVKKKTQLSDLKGMIMRAYDGSSISRRLRDKKVGVQKVTVADVDSVREPMLTILAGSTPERMASVCNREDIEDGFLPRWGIVWPTSRPPIRHLGPPDPEVDKQRAHIVRLLGEINNRVSALTQVFLTSEAWAVANEAEERLTNASLADELNAPFYARAEVRILKIAALMALVDDLSGKGSITVHDYHVADADRLVTKWLEDAKRFAQTVGLNEFEGSLQRVLNALKRRGLANRRELARVANVPAKVMDEIERTLLDRGYITVVEAKAGSKEWTLL